MPGWSVHNFVDRALFHKSYYKIHRKMDQAYFYFGRGHRVLFHDFLSAYAIARYCYPNDENAVLAANYHIIVDEICTRDPEFKKVLEQLVILDKAKKPLRKKERKRASRVEESVVSDLKKLAKLKRMTDYYYSHYYSHY